jgi:hypothetical protein
MNDAQKLEKALLAAVRKDVPRLKVERKESKRPLTMVHLRTADGRKLGSFNVPLAGTTPDAVHPA